MRFRSAKTFIVIRRADGWSVAAGGAASVENLDLSADALPAVVAATVAERLAALGYRRGNVVLALPSPWCLSAPLAAGDTPRADRRGALLFRLEEKLPLAAEDVAADFVTREDGILGVCVPVDLASPIVEAMEEAGVRVAAVCPLALLAIQEMAGSVADFDVCLWADGESLDLLQLADGRPRLWYSLANEPAGVALHLGLIAAEKSGPVNVRAIGVITPIVAAISALPGLHVVSQPGEPMAVAAARATERWGAEKLDLWIDLRRDGLASPAARRRLRRPLVAAAVAALLFLTCLTGALFWRAAGYDRLAASYDQQQATLFRQAFPGEPLPAAPRARLAGEERKLRGNGGDAAGPAQPSAMLVLYEALSRLPTDIRYRISELRVSEGTFSLDGQALSHADAEAMAAALRSGGGFRAELPRSEQAGNPPGSVRFTLSGTLVAPLTSAAPLAQPNKAAASLTSQPATRPSPSPTSKHALPPEDEDEEDSR